MADYYLRGVKRAEVAGTAAIPRQDMSPVVAAALDAPGKLRHRLRSTVALLIAVIRHSVSTPRDLASYAAHLEDRLDAIARAQVVADQFGQGDLQTLITDELLK